VPGDGGDGGDNSMKRSQAKKHCEELRLPLRSRDWPGERKATWVVSRELGCLDAQIEP